MPMTAHVRCGRCDEVFPSDASMRDEVVCPACGHRGTPAGVMRPSGFPSLEEFRRNIEAARNHEQRQA